MEIKLKRDSATKLDRQILKHIKQSMTNTELKRVNAFASGSNGIVISFKYESDISKVEFMINKKSISFNNITRTDIKNWTNPSLHIEHNIKRIKFEGSTFSTLNDLYEYVFDKYCDIKPFTSTLEIKSITDDESHKDALNMLNDFIKNKSTHLYKDTTYTSTNDDYSDVNSYQVCPFLFADDADMKLTFTPDGSIRMESIKQKIKKTINNLTSSDYVIHENGKEIPYNTLFTLLLSTDSN